MCSITGVGERLHKVLGQIGSKLWFPIDSGFLLTYNGENDVSTFSRLFLIRSFILAGNKDMHKISEEFEVRPDRTTDYGVNCLEHLKNSHRLIMGKCCHHASSFSFYQIIIKVAGNQDRHKSSDEFDFGLDQTTNFGITLESLHFRT